MTPISAQTIGQEPRSSVPDGVRERLLATMPVTERRLSLAGVSTAILEAGEGPPVVLLHGAGEFAATWMWVIPGLLETHRVIVPDLPGHGASEVIEPPLDVDRVLAWLERLIEETCPSPPSLVGHLLGGVMAARVAIQRPGIAQQLVLVDSYGLGRLRPSFRFAFALMGFLGRPTERSQERLFRQCFTDLDGLRGRRGEQWELLEAYALDRARDPHVKATVRVLMRQLGMPRIPPADLARIAVPVTLIWGRQDLQVRLRIAQAASARHGWPLHVIEDAGDDPAVERPEAFLEVLRGVLAAR